MRKLDPRDLTLLIMAMLAAVIWSFGPAFAAPPVVGSVLGLNPTTGRSLRPPPSALPIPLNATPHRWTLPDAGQSILVGAANANGTCVDLTGICSSTLLFVPNAPVNVCFWPQKGSPVYDGGAFNLNIYDGGCNATDTDPNFGEPLPAWTPQTMLIEDVATTMCAVSDAGAFRIPLFCKY